MRHNESKLQQSCVRYFRLAFPKYAHLLFAVPNGVATTATQGRILKAEGMMAGVADLILLVPRKGYGAMCLEMKTAKGIQCETQKIWQVECERAGNRYVVVRSFDQFREVVVDYLGEDDGLDVQSARNQLSELLNKTV
ncbi:MAG: VRR-NUC domain-containing protein [Bacteroidales bacterium]|nr:VRR-NUC domain-containing protein [Bacteroidales bacterium]